jgi:hypothetical protein
MCDAWAEWDADAQKWTLGETYENSFCRACDGECHIVDAEVDDAPADYAEAAERDRLTT